MKADSNIRARTTIDVYLRKSVNSISVLGRELAGKKLGYGPFKVTKVNRFNVETEDFRFSRKLFDFRKVAK